MSITLRNIFIDASLWFVKGKKWVPFLWHRQNVNLRIELIVREMEMSKQNLD